MVRILVAILAVAAMIAGSFLAGRASVDDPDRAELPSLPEDLRGIEPGHPESYYRNLWAEHCGGEVEIRLPDKSRVDVLTDGFAIEIEHSEKWREGVGQALHYGRMSGRKPVLVLICEKNESHHLLALRALVDQYGIELETRMIQCW